MLKKISVRSALGKYAKPLFAVDVDSNQLNLN